MKSYRQGSFGSSCFLSLLCLRFARVSLHFALGYPCPCWIIAHYNLSTPPLFSDLEWSYYRHSCTGFCSTHALMSLGWVVESWNSHVFSSGRSSQKYLDQFIVLSTMHESSNCSMSLSPLSIISLLHFSHSGIYVEISHCGLNLHLPDEWWYWASFATDWPLEYLLLWSVCLSVCRISTFVKGDKWLTK